MKCRRIDERPDHGAQVVRPDPDVAVAHHQDVVPGVPHHVAEVRDLAVRARQRPDREHDVPPREVALDLPHHRHRGIARVLDAEHDLVGGVVQPAEAREVVVEVDAGALERLQHRHRRQRHARRQGAARPRRAPEEPPRGEPLEEVVPARDESAGEHEGDPRVHQACALVSGCATPLRVVFAIRRRLAIEPMNCTPSPRSRFASSRLLAIFLTDFQM